MITSSTRRSERQKIFYNPCHVGMNATERGEVKIRVSLWCGGRLVKLNSSSGQGSSSIDCVADQDSSEDEVNRPWTDKKHFNSRWGAFDPMQSWRTSAGQGCQSTPKGRAASIGTVGPMMRKLTVTNACTKISLGCEGKHHRKSTAEGFRRLNLKTYHSRSEQEFTIPCHWQMVNELTTDRPITTICSRCLGGHGSREPEIGSPQLIYGFNVASKFVVIAATFASAERQGVDL